MMVLLSFSVKEAELLAGTKTRTTRLYTHKKYALWQSTIPSPYNLAPRFLDGWWKPRVPKVGYKMFQRPGADLYALRFRILNDRPWPYRLRTDSGLYTPMTTDEFKQYIREEGFEGHHDALLGFFDDHYAPLEDKVFQSIAFPVPRTVA